MDKKLEDGHYLLGSCLAARKKFELAYQELKIGFAIIDNPGEDIIRLNAFICNKLDPPRFVEAYENFDHIVRISPGDMNAVRYA